MTGAPEFEARRPALLRQATTSSGRAAEAGLARHLSELAREVQHETDVDQMMLRITHAALRELPSAVWAGISLLQHGQFTTRGATDSLVEKVDYAQYSLNEGPCVDSSRRERSVRSDDLRKETRWPRFASAAAALGVMSMASVQLFVEEDNIGALNLYSPEPNAFTEWDESSAVMLAAHAAIALADQRALSQLHEALDVRDLVGQAKGILMERFQINSRQAFDLLSLASQNTNRKLTTVARDLIRCGELTGPADAPDESGRRDPFGGP